jgi:hypothetical protein
VSQAERYFGFVPDTTEDLGIPFTEMVGQYIIEHGIKEKPPGGRIMLIEDH